MYVCCCDYCKFSALLSVHTTVYYGVWRSPKLIIATVNEYCRLLIGTSAGCIDTVVQERLPLAVSAASDVVSSLSCVPLAVTSLHYTILHYTTLLYVQRLSIIQYLNALH